jgi:prevent-host-death family protein
MRQRAVGVAQAKKSFSELLGRVAYRGESIVIEKRGRALARLVPITQERKPSLARVRGWLDDDDPFFAAITAIVAARHTRRPRTAARRRRRR